MQSFDVYPFSWTLFFPRFKAQRPPPKRASKTSALARERQREKREAAKSVKMDIFGEECQEVVDWLLRRRQETSWEESVRVCRGISKDGNKIPPPRQKETPGILWRPSRSMGDTRHSGLQWPSSPDKISINIRKVPHRARTVRQHSLNHGGGGGDHDNDEGGRGEGR